MHFRLCCKSSKVLAYAFSHVEISCSMVTDAHCILCHRISRSLFFRLSCLRAALYFSRPFARRLIFALYSQIKRTQITDFATLYRHLLSSFPYSPVRRYNAPLISHFTPRFQIFTLACLDYLHVDYNIFL